MTWIVYETGLEDRLADLHNCVHRGTYRAQPSRGVYIPKADGRQRPLGIAALENKIVQQAMVAVLNEIYAADLLDFSYEVRPGRNGAAAFSGAEKLKVPHVQLQSGDRCPECAKGKVDTQKEPKPLVRVIGQATLAATVYELERLRCNGRGQVFTAQEPEGIGPDKYETTAAMITQVKYGSGVPFYRFEKLEHNLGIPMPAATQWEIVEEAEVLKPAQEGLSRQAARGEVLHNDDTSMRVLQLAREPSDKHTGVFNSGIVAIGQAHKIALYFTGCQHAGENLADVLNQRVAELRPPIQMCDALSHNVPKLAAGVEILIAH